jgi:hypothetical protein
LRNIQLVSQAVDGDLMAGLIFAAIIQANVRGISGDPELSKKYGPMGEIPPDRLRRPISVNALSEQLGVPYETTRRHVNRLLAKGWCVKVGARGVIVPGAVIGAPTMIETGIKQYAYLIQFLRQLGAIGFKVDGPALPD